MSCKFGGYGGCYCGYLYDHHQPKKIAVMVAVDLNVRIGRYGTYSGFEDVQGEMPKQWDFVLAWEREDNIVTNGIITEIDPDRKLIYLTIAWGEWRGA
jgi:hypothetical protein